MDVRHKASRATTVTTFSFHVGHEERTGLEKRRAKPQNGPLLSNAPSRDAVSDEAHRQEDDDKHRDVRNNLNNLNKTNMK